MRFMTLFMLYDFIQVLNIKMKHSTKNEHFFQAYSIFYNLFTVETEIESYKYSEHELNMGNFCTS
jgi:hypothetical protein